MRQASFERGKVPTVKEPCDVNNEEAQISLLEFANNSYNIAIFPHRIALKLISLMEEPGEKERINQQNQNLSDKSKNSVKRPPNAFILFAKEHREELSKEHPHEENRYISKLLGRKWAHLKPEKKMEYYKKANELAQQHKSKYPGYVYNPHKARFFKSLKKKKKNAYECDVKKLLPEEENIPVENYHIFSDDENIYLLHEKLVNEAVKIQRDNASNSFWKHP
ncbi:Sex-determining region Y protein [Nymphon striatum]|nr:Sex-determining region Y protein [Nymphon striatum]